jgi:hypothetical protein
MALQIRRGTEAQRAAPGFVPKAGELIWTNDLAQLWVGDNSTAGGIGVAMNSTLPTLAGANLDYNPTTKAIDLNLTGITTNDILEGTNNKYFSDELARDAVGLALTNGNAYNTGITFVNDDVNNRITATVSVSGISMGGNLSSNLVLSGYNITGTGNINITGNHALTGNLTGTGDITRTGNVNITGNIVTTGNQSVTGIVYAPDGSLAVGSTALPSTVNVKSNLPNIAQFTGLTSVASPLYVDVNVSAGTLSAPTVPTVGSEVGGYRVQLWTGTEFVTSSAIQTNVSNNANLTSANPQSDLILAVANNTTFSQYVFSGSGTALFPGDIQVGDGTAADPSIAFSTDGGVDTGLFHPGDGILSVSTNAQESARFTSGGIKSFGFIQVAQVNGTLPTPAAGMIVLDGTTFKGYNGSAWVNLN